MIDLHTHTWRCKHASGTVADYAASAANRGISVLGVSDHVPLPDGAWPEPRMGMDELPAYLEEIAEARRRHVGLRILAGFECEYHPRYEAYYREELLGRLGLDYLIAGQHWFDAPGGIQSVYDPAGPKSVRAYAASVVAAMKSGLFAFIAHPDLFGYFHPRWDGEALAASREILSAAAELGVPLEVNGLGLRKPVLRTVEGVRPPYPWSPFWELAVEYPVVVCFNSDAHRPEDVGAGIAEGHRLVSALPLAEIREAPLSRRSSETVP
ncbi:MAG: histidinol-phosphatase [Spirochaetes bacterium]|nr:histidinol-phosphatase [Spirochaetota bacterium]